MARLFPRLRIRERSVRAWVVSRRLAAPVALVLLALAWVGWARCGVGGCPDLDRVASYRPGQASVLLDRNGEPFADLSAREYRIVPLDSLPSYVPDAFVAVEDRRFYRHGGVDWIRVLGAAWVNLRDRSLLQGSSTLSMQLARTLFPERIRREDRTLGRKLLEIRVALQLEARFTKRELLELYLNHIYLGGGTYGVRAASRYWFGKDAKDLSLEEAALLAGLPRAPTHYDPRRNPEAARRRRDLVLALMEREGVLAPRLAAGARDRPLGVAEEPLRTARGAGAGAYFVQQVRRELEDELGERLYAEPLRITTTLDLGAQRRAEAALAEQLAEVERGAFGAFPGPPYRVDAETDASGTPYLQGAVVLMDVREGDVLAWVGGRDFGHSRFDRARLARRPAGSAFKPFVYGAALEAGFALSQPILDAPYVLKGGDEGDWEPRNYLGDFRGPMSMREALVRSQNVPVVRLAAAVGAEGVGDFARRAGLTGKVPPSPVSALGVTAVSPLEMTAAYAAFAAQGLRPAPRFVLRVEDARGRVLLETRAARTEVTDPAVAFLLTDVLRDVVDQGTGVSVRREGLTGPAAGKTGTSDGVTDLWFAGYTPRVAGTVWIGFDGLRPLPAGASGGRVAAPVWARIVGALAAEGGEGDAAWTSPPPGVLDLPIHPETGMALSDRCARGGDADPREYFLASHVPATTCPAGGIRKMLDRLGGWLGSIFGGRENRESRPREDVDPDLGLPRVPERVAGANPPRRAAGPPPR